MKQGELIATTDPHMGRHAIHELCYGKRTVALTVLI